MLLHPVLLDVELKLVVVCLQILSSFLHFRPGLGDINDVTDASLASRH